MNTQTITTEQIKNNDTTPILQIKNLGYKYVLSKSHVLSDLNYSFNSGKLYTIVGKSGAGKTTLLSLLSGLTSPTSGSISYQGNNISRHYDKFSYRAKAIGVIFQSFNLLPHLTALENIILSMDVSGKKYDRSKHEIALDLLEKVHLPKEYASRKILKLSGGEQQRVAIARALSFDPDVILADEPTGNLDKDTQNDILSIFKDLVNEDNKCVIIVTHSDAVTAQADEIITLSKGKFINIK